MKRRSSIAEIQKVESRVKLVARNQRIEQRTRKEILDEADGLDSDNGGERPNKTVFDVDEFIMKE
jgi:hypothetical protein